MGYPRLRGYHSGCCYLDANNEYMKRARVYRVEGSQYMEANHTCAFAKGILRTINSCRTLATWSACITAGWVRGAEGIETRPMETLTFSLFVFKIVNHRLEGGRRDY